MNPDAELQKLRWSLSNGGWLPNELDEIIDIASRDINESILNIVSNAIAEITDYAIDIGAEEFIGDVDVQEIGGGFIITTRSGTMDYSTPERHMLPDLVRNGKVSEEGYKYQVIPIGAKKKVKPIRNIFNTMRDQVADQQEARASLLQNSMDNRSARAQHMASQFKSIITDRLQQLHAQRASAAAAEGNYNTGGAVKFATASEKQDAATQWVLPAKEMDMTGYIMDTNKRIEEAIRVSVDYIVSSYEREFA